MMTWKSTTYVEDKLPTDDVETVGCKLDVSDRIRASAKEECENIAERSSWRFSKQRFWSLGLYSLRVPSSLERQCIYRML
jgi:hypothetical protein